MDNFNKVWWSQQRWKVQNTNRGPEEHKNWSEKFTWTVHQHIKQERINKLKDKLLEIIQSEEQKRKEMNKTEGT